LPTICRALAEKPLNTGVLGDRVLWFHDCCAANRRQAGLLRPPGRNQTAQTKIPGMSQGFGGTDVAFRPNLFRLVTARYGRPRVMTDKRYQNLSFLTVFDLAHGAYCVRAVRYPLAMYGDRAMANILVTIKRPNDNGTVVQMQDWEFTSLTKGDRIVVNNGAHLDVVRKEISAHGTVGGTRPDSEYAIWTYVE